MTDEKDDLFIHSDSKIEKLREEFTEAVRRLDGLEKEQGRITERIDKGVSQTAFKAFELVNTLMAKVNEMAGTDQVTDNRLNTVERHNDWIIKGFVIVIAAGIILAWLRK